MIPDKFHVRYIINAEVIYMTSCQELSCGIRRTERREKEERAARRNRSEEGRQHTA